MRVFFFHARLALASLHLPPCAGKAPNENDAVDFIRNARGRSWDRFPLMERIISNSNKAATQSFLFCWNPTIRNLFGSFCFDLPCLYDQLQVVIFYVHLISLVLSIENAENHIRKIVPINYITTRNLLKERLRVPQFLRLTFVWLKQCAWRAWLSSRLGLSLHESLQAQIEGLDTVPTDFCLSCDSHGRVIQRKNTVFPRKTFSS